MVRMGKATGFHPPGSALLFSLIKMETFLRDELDSPQRSSALTFSLCIGQGKCCKSAIRSRVTPARLTRYLQISVFALHGFSSWPSVATAAWSVASAGGRHPGKVMHPSGHWKGHASPMLSGCLLHPVVVGGQRKPAWSAFFVQ